MRLTHSSENNTTLHDLRTMLRQSIVAFVNRYAETFEGLVRSGNPFGGNWLPLTLIPNKSEVRLNGRIESELSRVQQQVNMLSQTVASLSNRVEQLSSRLSTGTPEQSVMSTNRPAKAHKNEIGINRYRALQQ